jgi:SAM-dependent methyltransferase
MKRFALDYLACPLTGSPLRLEDADSEGEVIRSGRLVSGEGRDYPIIDRIAYLGLDPGTAAEAQTVHAFGTEWNRFDRCEEFLGSEELFFNFFSMLRPRDFTGKVCLDAGCGNGRWLTRLAGLGCQRVIGLDYSTAVIPAERNTRDLPNVTVVQGSILRPPLRRSAFDLIMSNGVIHHLDDPAGGLAQLGTLLTQPDGRLGRWVYGYEGNELYLRLVAPLRKLGPILPHPVLILLSGFLAARVWLHCHTVNRWLGVRSDGTPRLPMAAYFDLLSRLSFRGVTNVVYDQLTPSLARYYRRQEIDRLIQEAELQLVELSRPRDNSYSALLRRG